MQDKISLKWDDFQDNINIAFGSLREDNNFSDVTLACEDGNQVEAHKVILVASSPFFRNLLIKDKLSHPLIYMKGVKLEDINAILDFLYYGVENVYQDNLETLLNLADELKLKGLHKSGNSKKNNLQTPPKSTTTEKLEYDGNLYEIKQDETEDSTDLSKITVILNNDIGSASVQDMRNRISEKKKPFTCLL